MLSEAKQYLLRALVAGVIATVSIAVGVYVGFTQSLQTSGDVTPDSLRNDSYLDIGEPMPSAIVSLIGDDREASLSKLLEGRRSLVVFMSGGCGACNTMIRYWNKKLVPKLATDIQIVCVYDQDELEDARTALQEEQLRNAIAVTVDDSFMRENAGIFVMPTTVGVSNGGIIAFIASGMDKRITSEFLDATL